MTTDKKPPHQVAEEIFYLIEKQGSAIAALGELILIADTQKFRIAPLRASGECLICSRETLLKPPWPAFTYASRRPLLDRPLT